MSRYVSDDYGGGRIVLRQCDYCYKKAHSEQEAQTFALSIW
jgi:hypothetical protein